MLSKFTNTHFFIKVSKLDLANFGRISEADNILKFQNKIKNKIEQT